MSPNIGYACLTVGVPETQLKSCVMKNASAERLRDLIGGNLDALGRMLDYNISAGIRLFRISSDIIPFGSSPANTLDWPSVFRGELLALGQKIKAGGMRVSMHPGQYTVLNSPDAGVVSRAVDDLRYHNRFLDALGVPAECKIILHAGGVYGDKEAALARFSAQLELLDAGIRSRLAIENDERCYSIGDILSLSRRLGVPAVYDCLHNAVNPADPARSDAYWVEACRETWQTRDGRQKIHYSAQAAGKPKGSHSAGVALDDFLVFYDTVKGLEPDIMLEVKDKNLSAVKCLNAVAAGRSMKDLEEEWSRYKYAVLERSQGIYDEIRHLLKDKNAYPVRAFYALIEKALDAQPLPGQAVNAAMHVWGYFKNIASPNEKAQFLRLLGELRAGGSAQSLKRFLEKCARRCQTAYLQSSYYFIF